MKNPDDTEKLPSGIASLMDSYIEGLLKQGRAGDERYQRLRDDLTAIAAAELGATFRPGIIPRASAEKALSVEVAEAPGERLRALEKCQLTEVPGDPPGQIRVALDPLAEHLVACQSVEMLSANRQRWAKFISHLQTLRGIDGFIAAVLECCAHPGYGRNVPPDIPVELSRIAANLHCDETGSTAQTNTTAAHQPVQPSTPDGTDAPSTFVPPPHL
jgi:hypothetical protein